MTKLLLGLLLSSQVTFAAEPTLRVTIPRTTHPPMLDGVLTPGEWDDAAATTGLISQFGQVAHPRQAVFWLKYDATNLYVAQRSTCFPEERDTVTPQLWLDRDSSIVVGLDPARLGRGASPSHFLLRANINKQLLGTEIFWSLEGAGLKPVKITFPHPSWNAGATIGQTITNGVWFSEISLPLKNLKAANLKEGEEWGLLLGRDYNAGDQCALTVSSDWRFGDGLRHWGRAFYNNYRLEQEYGRMKFGGQTPVVQLLDLGDVAGGHPAPTVTVKNTTPAPLRVILREEWGRHSPAQETAIDLAPGQLRSHIFRTVTLRQGQTQHCRITVTGPTGVLLAQEIPLNPGWGADRCVPTPEAYFAGYHFGEKSPGDVLFATAYDPIANEFDGRLRLNSLPDAHLAVRGEVRLRHQGESRLVATLPLHGPRPNVMLAFHDLSFGSRPATVLEWVAPEAGVLGIRLEGAHYTFDTAVTHTDGEALQVLHVSAADQKTTVLIPRQVFDKVNQWVPLVVDNLRVQAGDKIQCYYDKNLNEGCDDFRLRGTLTLTTSSRKVVYYPAADISSQPGGRTGGWFYRYDTDSTPNPDGLYPELTWMTQTNWFNFVGWMKLWPADPTRHMALIRQVVECPEWIAEAKLPVLTPGVYEATASIYAQDGQVVGRTRQMFIRYDHRKDLPWLSEKVGVSTNVLPPWTPIRATKAAGGLGLDCWGRTYQIGGDGLVGAIHNQGIDPLAAPVHLECQPVTFTAGTALTNVKHADHEASYTGQQHGGGLRITTTGRMEYDGYIEQTVKIAPTKGPVRVESLRLVIPLKPEEATHLHAAGGENMRASVASIKLAQADGQLWHSGQEYGGGCETPSKEPFGKRLMTVGNFRPYVWIGNAERGLAFMADNDGGWVPDDSGRVPAIAVVRTNGVVKLVLNLVARPFTFTKARTITFSLQATPIRPLPDDIRARRHRLNMASAFPGGRGPDTGWAWNGQMYNIKDDTAGGQPYYLFGNPGSTPYPLSWDLSTWYREACEAGGFHGYRCIYTPYQSQLNVMTFPEVDDPRMPPGKQASDVYGYVYPHMSAGHVEDGNAAMAEVDVDYRLYCYRAWIRQVGIKGMYFDQTQPELTANPALGFGCVLDLPDRPALDGKLQAGYGLTRMRDFYKRLRTLFVESGVTEPYLWLHSTDANLVSAFAFAEFLLEGENGPYVNLTTPVDEKIPPARMQAMRSSAGGLSMTQLEMIEYGKPYADKLVWRDVAGWFMLHDTAGAGLYYAYDWAGLDLNRAADFLAYWTPAVAAALRSSDPEIYASAWRQDNALRVEVFNRRGEARKNVTLRIDPKALGIQPANGRACVVTDLEQGVPKDGFYWPGDVGMSFHKDGELINVTLDVLPHNYRLLRIEQSEK